MAALAVLLKDRRDLFGVGRRIHVSHLRECGGCRTNCENPKETRTSHGIRPLCLGMHIWLMQLGDHIKDFKLNGRVVDRVLVQ